MYITYTRRREPSAATYIRRWCNHAGCSTGRTTAYKQSPHRSSTNKVNRPLYCLSTSRRSKLKSNPVGTASVYAPIFPAWRSLSPNKARRCKSSLLNHLCHSASQAPSSQFATCTILVSNNPRFQSRSNQVSHFSRLNHRPLLHPSPLPPIFDLFPLGAPSSPNSYRQTDCIPSLPAHTNIYVRSQITMPRISGLPQHKGRRSGMNE